MRAASMQPAAQCVHYMMLAAADAIARRGFVPRAWRFSLAFWFFVHPRPILQ